MIRRSRPVLRADLLARCCLPRFQSAGAGERAAERRKRASRRAFPGPARRPPPPLAAPRPRRAFRAEARRPHGRTAAGTGAGAPAAAAPAAAPIAPPLRELRRRELSRDSAENQLSASSSSRPTKGCAWATASCSSRSTRHNRVYDEAGNSLAGPFNVNGPFKRRAEGIHERSAPATTTLLTTPGSRSSSRSDRPKKRRASNIAVNSSGDPPPRSGPPTRSTRPTLKGTNVPASATSRSSASTPSNLYVTTDEFSILGPAFNGDHLYAFRAQGPRRRQAGRALRALLEAEHRGRTGEARSSRRSPPAKPRPSTSWTRSTPTENRRQQHRRVGADRGRGPWRTAATPALSNVVLSSEALRAARGRRPRRGRARKLKPATIACSRPSSSAASFGASLNHERRASRRKEAPRRRRLLRRGNRRCERAKSALRRRSSNRAT